MAKKSWREYFFTKGNYRKRIFMNDFLHNLRIRSLDGGVKELKARKFQRIWELIENLLNVVFITILGGTYYTLTVGYFFHEPL